jgi:FlgN protein
VTQAIAPDERLARAVVTHLETQIESARRLLASVLAQGAAIRDRDVESVLARLAELKTEMARRQQLEEERSALLRDAGKALGVTPAAVTLEAMTTLMPPDAAAQARGLSSELKGLLGEIAREHGINRALMRQELSFLDHLVRLIGQEPSGGYSPGGGDQFSASHRVLDTRA